MACYRPEKAEKVKEMLVRDTGNPHIEVLGVDLSSLASVAAFAEILLKRGDAVGLLMNNAGTMETERRITEDGLERTVSVNYVALFADAQTSSSDGRRKPYREYGVLYLCYRTSRFSGLLPPRQERGLLAYSYL